VSTADPDDTADVAGDGPPDPFAEAAGREEILALLEDAVREAHRKVESGRVYDAENEQVRIKWIRTLAYAAGQYRQLLKDKDLEEFNERLERIEARHGDR
jgi:hypothetical protein